MDRVSREPLNPPPSADLWPYNNAGHKEHLEKEGGKFSHTYPERFWPRWAGTFQPTVAPSGDGNRGIRYRYGDLGDVIDMLGKSPYTRQAYLPVWFPEDTGNQGVRLPCSLGYHFILRNDQLHCNYFIRSVDFVRHFRDDFYMAGRLLQWVLSELRRLDGLASRAWESISPGHLHMYMISLHCMEGDVAMLRRKIRGKN